tara:strand:- start:47207 stop:47431 length:225 start_codon:yes stop_codon:yes gene_type:complete
MDAIIEREESGKLTPKSYRILINMAMGAGYKNLMPSYPKKIKNQSAWVGYYGRFNNWYRGLKRAMKTQEEIYYK